MIEFFSPGGEPLTQDEWEDLCARRHEDMKVESWWRKQTQIDDGVHVSTVWIGLNLQWNPDKPPLYWETMVFGSGEDDDDANQWRYSSREQALDDHERIVRELRAARSAGSTKGNP